MYEEHQALKVNINALRDENVRLKTRVNQLEKEVGKYSDMLGDQTSDKLHQHNAHLVAGLKQSVKDLKAELHQRDEENADLRKNIKTTRTAELEVELQAYIDECTRLRHHLEEVIARQTEIMQFDLPPENLAPRSQQELITLRTDYAEVKRELELAQQELEKLRERNKSAEKPANKPKKSPDRQWKSEIAKLKFDLEKSERQKADLVSSYEADKRRLMSDLSLKEEQIRKMQAKITESEQANSSLQKQSQELQEELKSMRGQLTEMQKEVVVLSKRAAPVKPGRVFEKVHRYITQKNTLISVFFSLLDRLNRGALDAMELQAGLKKYGISVRLDQVEEAVFVSSGGKPTVTLAQLERQYEKCDFSQPYESSSEEEERKPKPEARQADVCTPEPRIAAKPPTERKTPEPHKPTESLKDSKVKTEEAKKTTTPKDKGKAEQPVDVAIPQRAEQSSTAHKEAETDKTEVPSKKSADASAKEPQQPSPVVSKDKPETPSYQSVRVEEVNELLRHISFRLQIHRITKDKIPMLLFGDSYDQHRDVTLFELQELLSQPPINITDPSQAELLSKFLLEPENPQTLRQLTFDSNVSSSVDAMLAKFSRALPDWLIFSPEDEEQYDDDIAEILTDHLSDLEAACEEADPEKKDFIHMSQFKDILSKLGVVFDPSHFKYLELLFYSHDFQLDRVPYSSFLRAYTKGEYSDEEDEDERGELIRAYLSSLAKALRKTSKTVREAFEISEEDRIYPPEFVFGARELGLRDLSKEDLVVILESLQDEEADELCVSLPYLEEIMQHYGVPPVNHYYVQEAESSEYCLYRMEYSDSPEKRARKVDSEVSEQVDSSGYAGEDFEEQQSSVASNLSY